MATDSPNTDNIATITTDIWYKAYARLKWPISGKEDSPVGVQDTIAACADICQEGMVAQEYPLVYEMMRVFKN